LVLGSSQFHCPAASKCDAQNEVVKRDSKITISLCLSNFFLLGVNFIKVLQAAFTRVDSKSTKKTSSHQCLFALMGPTHVKAACKMLVKLTPGLISFLIFFICTSECCVSVKCVTSNSTPLNSSHVIASVTQSACLLFGSGDMFSQIKIFGYC